ncbi:MAG: BMP family ABC transporter substrate-binding protein [Erysipelotrichaceae bacterium]|nr:BMP family ABC transporter substrate-binding protein [Erysipelotrichaceae bacterium]
MNDDYSKAKRMADRSIRRAVLQGRYPYLSDLDSKPGMSDVLSCIDLGIKEIPLQQIRGTKTKGRQGVFSYDFLPCAEKDSEFAMKWNAVYRYQNEEGISDPIEVYEYLHDFYVEEGNKRVSVLKYLDSISVRARVRRIVPDAKTLEENPVYKEFLDFYKLCPLYEIDLHEKNAYRKLIRLLKKPEDRPWEEQDVSRLRSSFYIFQKNYLKLDYDPDYCADAFLLYVSAYDYDKLYSLSDQKLSARIKELDKELTILGKEEKIEVLHNPVSEKQPVIDLDPLNLLPLLSEEKKLRIGFIYENKIDDSFIDFDQELGRLQVQADLEDKIFTVKYEGAGKNEALKDVISAATKENDVVFTTSPLQFEETFRAAIKNKDVKYLNRSVYMKQNAVRTYEVRMYEAQFLLGLVAAIYAKDHQIGYIADTPNYGSIASINAFAIGASMVDPEAKVWLGWTESLDRDWQDQMRRIGISTFCGPQYPDFTRDDLQYGLYVLNEKGAVNIAQPLINWGTYYKKLITSILDGTYSKASAKDKATNYWWGISSGVLDIHLSEEVPYPTKKLVSVLKDAIRKESFDPFEGELRSTEKQIKGPFSARLTYEQIITMHWLNSNIIGIIPEYGQLSDKGKEVYELTGTGS